MPSYSITAPNGKTYRMTGPAGLTQQDLIAHVMGFDPDAGTLPPPPKTGVMAALQSGLENLGSSSVAAVKGGFGDTQAAAAEALAAQKAQARKYDPQVGLSRVGEAYDKDGIWAATKEIGAQVPRAIAQSLPQMATAAGGAKLGAMAGTALAGPVGGIVGGGLGAIAGGFLPMTGQNLAQQQEQTPGQVSYGKAAAAGAVQSGLEAVTPLALMGGRVASKIFGKEAAAIAARLGPEAAEEVAKRGLAQTLARGGAKGTLGEAGTEVLQDALGRAQSGQALLSEDALKSYAESAYGGALAGAPLGTAGAVWDRSGAQREVAATEQEQRAAAQAQTAATAQAQAQAAAQAEAAKKADPDYAAKVGEQYAAYEQQKQDMKARVIALAAEKTDAGRAAAVELNRELKALVENAKPLIAEFNATRPARAAMAAQRVTDPGEPPVPAGALFGGYENEQTQQRVVQLQNVLSEHEALMPQAQEQLLEIMRTGKSTLIAQARAGLAKREQQYAKAQAELFKLAPELQAQHAADAADEAHKAKAQTINPVKTQKQIDALTAKLDSVNDPSEAAQAQKWAAEREKLQALLKTSQEQQTAVMDTGYDEDLFQLDDRMQRQQDVVGRRQARTSESFDADLAAEDAALGADLTASAAQDTPARRKQDTADALGRVFGTEPRSGMLDVLGETPETGVAHPRETGAMEQVAAEGKQYGEHPAPVTGRTRPGKGPTLPPESRGTVTLEDAQGQGMLFTPEGAPSTTPAELLRQRVSTLLAMPRLAAPAKATLQRAADLLDRPDVPQRILDTIAGTVAQAEKGAGRRIDVREGDKVVSDDGRLRLQTRRDVTPASEEREVQGTGVLVGDEGETFPGSPTAKVRTAGRGERTLDEQPLAVRPLEMEEIGDAGPDADKQPDLFHKMHAGRATPANFQRALDTGALPSKRTGAEARKHHQGMRTAVAILRVKAAGLKARIADAAAAAKRLAGMDQDFATMPDAQREALKATLHDNKMAATKSAQKAKDTAARYKALAESPQFMTDEGAGDRAYEYAGRAAQAEQEALKQEQRIADYDDTLNAVISANGAPSAHKMAVRHEALTQELAQVEKDAAAVGKDAKKREQQARKKVQERRGHRATAASAKAGLGGMPTNTVLDAAAEDARTTAAYKADTAAKDRTERKAARKAAATKIAAERVQAQEAAEQENKEYLRKRKEAAETGARTYNERTGRDVKQHRAQPKATTVDEVNDAMADIIDTALAVPGVTKEALQKLFKRVRNYPQRGVDSRTSVVGNELSRLEDETNRFRAANPGGIMPLKHRKSYQQAVLEKGHRDEQLKAAKSAADRTPLMKRIAELDSHLKWLNDKRTPLLGDPKYQELRTKAALLQFQLNMIDMHRDALAAGQVLPEAPTTIQPKPEKGMVHVEPSTKLITDEINPLFGHDEARTRMSVAEELGAKSKFGYKNRAYSPTEESKQAAEATVKRRKEEDAALKAAKEEKVAKGKPAKLTPLQALKAMQTVAAKRIGGNLDDTVPKVVSDAFEASDQTAMTAGMMERAHAGQLDKVLQAMTTDAQTPLAQELADKLQAFTKDTNLVVSDLVAQDTVGHYDPATNTITLHPLAMTEENLQHEATHAATLRALVAPASSLTKDQLNARNELQALLKRLQADPAFKREYGAENAAELASELVTNQGLRDKIDAQKPALWTRIKRAVLQMLGMKPQALSAQAMANVEKLFQPARKFTPAEMAAFKEMTGKTVAPAAARAAAPQSAMDRASALLTAEPERTGVMGFIKDSNAGLAAEQALVDQRAGILKALSKGDRDAFMQNQYFLRKSDARMSQVYAVLQNGPLQLQKDSKGNRVIEAGGGPSAKAIFEEIGKLPYDTPEKQFAAAQNYMVAQRAANKGWDKLGFETSADKQAALEQALAEVKADPALKAQLDAVRDMYGEYNKGMVKFLADTGSIPQAEAQRLLKDNDYVPFYRVGASGVAELVLNENTNVRIGDVRKQPHLQKLKGDEGKLVPLNDAIMRNTMLLTDMGLSNLTTKSIAYSLQDMSRGPDGKSLNPIHSGKAPAGADIITFRQEPAAGEEGPDAGKRWMRITSEGTPFEGIPAELLVQSLEGSHLVMTGLGKIASKFGDTLRKGVTRTPAYLIRQLIRDPMSASFTAGLSRGPVAATLETMREFVSQTRGTSATAEALLRKGVAQSGVFTGDADDLGAFALQLASGKQGAIDRLCAMADRAAMRADSATRVQVYEDTLKATGSEMEAELAAMEMMNFTKRGSSPSVQHAARMIPFMNAQIQSLNVLVKAFRGNATMEEQLKIRDKFIKNAIGLSIFSLVYAMGMEENEEYKNATAQERYNNFFIPLPGITLKVPIPYEVGFFFKALPEALVHQMNGELDEPAMKALGGAMLNMIPGASSLGMPQMVKPAVEAMMNRNIFSGREIETAEQQKVDPELRYNENTTEAAKELSSLAGGALSPVKIEHLVRGYLGGLPIAAASLANEFLGSKTEPDRRGSGTPLLGGFIADEVGRGPVERAWAKAKAIEQAGATYDRLVKEGKYAAALKYREDNLGVLGAEQLNTNFTSMMKRFKDARADVLAAEQMSSAEKRKRLDAIERARNEQADLFTRAVKSVATAQ